MIHYEVAGVCDIGNVRRTNQDRVFHACSSQSACALLAVADGMGGTNDGMAASEICVRLIAEEWENIRESGPDIATAHNLLHKVFVQAHTTVLRASERKDLTMGSTLTVMYLKDRQFTIAHVGDSRAYIFNGHIMRQLTEDHTLAYQRYKANLIKREDITKDSGRNILTNYIGNADGFSVDFSTGEIVEGEVVMICSDGFYRHMDVIRTGVSFGAGHKLNDILNAAARKIKKSDASDNISIAALMLSLG